MATKNTAIADLNLSEIATNLGITQGKVKEIANGLLDKNLEATPELITQVVTIYKEKNWDPMIAIDYLAENLRSETPENQGDGNTELVTVLADQVYSGLAPLAPIVQDIVAARFAVEIATGIATGTAFKNPGKHTKSVFSAFAAIAKSSASNLPSFSLQESLAAAKGKTFLAIAPSVEQLD